MRPARRARLRPRHPAQRPGPVELLRQAAAAGEGEGTREDAAGAGQGQLARDRAPSGVPRLRRREDLRRGRRGRRRAPLPGPVLERGLHRVRHPHPGAAREGHRGHAPRRLRPAQPRRQGADGHPGELPARRAVPHLARRARPDRAGRDVRPRAAPAAGLRAPRHLRPLRLRPGLPPARPLQHRRARALLRHPARGPRRRARRVHRPGQRVHHRARALRGPPAQGRAHPGDQRRRPRAPPDRGVALVARRLHGRRGERVRRGPRVAAGPGLGRRVPRGVQGGLPPPARGRRRRPHRGHRGTCGHRPRALRPGPAVRFLPPR